MTSTCKFDLKTVFFTNFECKERKILNNITFSLILFAVININQID